MKFRIRHADRIVGLFMVLAGFALLGSIAMAGASQRWFAKDPRFRTVLASAAGAAPGTAIFMRGFQVGKIEDLRLDEGNNVIARFSIYGTYRSQVRVDSLIEIVTSPIGLGTQILFHPGKGTELLAEGGLVPEALSKEGKDIIEGDRADIPKKDNTITRLLSGVNPLIDDINRTVESLNRTLTEVNKALTGEGSTPVARIVEEAAGAVKGVNSFVGNADRTIVDLDSRIGTVLTQVDSLAANLSTVSSNLAKLSEGLSDPTGLVPRLLAPEGSIKTLLNDNNALYDGLNRSIAEVQSAVKGLSDVANSLAAEVPGISATILQIDVAVRQAQDVLEGLRNNPLLRGGIPTRTEQPAVFQSLREGLF